MTPEQERKLDEVHAMLKSLLAKGGGSSNGAASKYQAGQVADDKLFQGQYGNPDVWKDFDAKDWPGESVQGKRFSDCPLEWLEVAAEVYDRMAAGMERKGNDKAWRVYQNAALCRRWAQEKRKEAPKRPQEWDDSNPLF